jgi:dTDP-4-amino-4,6-dideoxygalactose transaminase
LAIVIDSSASKDSAEAVPFLDLAPQHQELAADLASAFARALALGMFVGGPEVTAFEEEFAAFVGTDWAVGVNSGTDALRFAYLAMDIRPGDEVVTVPNTFIATTAALTQAGASVRFADVNDDVLTMDPRALEAAITPRTVGIVPVHLFGQPADMDPILSIARQHGLWVVEDAAQAHGARYKDRPAGTMGALAAFSFYPGKNLGACGEAGAVVGSDRPRCETVRRLREHGQSRKYVHEVEGYNGRLDAIQAAFLRVKLKRLEQWNEARRKAAGMYREALNSVSEVRLPTEAAYARHVYHLFVIRAERRDEVQARLAASGITTGLHYPVPLHLQNAYRHLDLGRGAFPVTEQAADSMLSLPMFPGITATQIYRVASVISKFYNG